MASLYTLTQCIALSDIQADGDWKLVIADLGTGSYDMKLKVYKGIQNYVIVIFTIPVYSSGMNYSLIEI